MINGQLAKTTRYLVTLLLIICLIGTILIALTNHIAPPILDIVIGTGLGFLVGTNFSNGSYKQENKGAE